MLTCLLRAAAQAARTSEAALFRRVQAVAESQVLQATAACLPTNAKAALQQQRLMATNSTDVFNVHHDTDDNNKETKFDFTKENYEKVNAIIANYPPNYKASAVIPVLDIAQQQNGGWLSLASMNKIAEILGMAPIRVYEVGTFYSMFNRSKVGKYYIQVCGTTPCRLNGAENILSALEKHLGIHMGQTTPDGMFTLGEMECMGCCVNAPMIVVSDYSNGVEGYSYNYYEDLTPQDAVKIAETYKAGKKPEKLGSQYRKTCEPAGHTAPGGGWNKLDGMTTLTETPPGPYCRDLDATPAK